MSSSLDRGGCSSVSSLRNVSRETQWLFAELHKIETFLPSWAAMIELRANDVGGADRFTRSAAVRGADATADGADAATGASDDGSSLGTPPDSSDDDDDDDDDGRVPSPPRSAPPPSSAIQVATLDEALARLVADDDMDIATADDSRDDADSDESW